jgi:hypothetical protein
MKTVLWISKGIWGIVIGVIIVVVFYISVIKSEKIIDSREKTATPVQEVEYKFLDLDTSSSVLIPSSKMDCSTRVLISVEHYLKKHNRLQKEQAVIEGFTLRFIDNNSGQTVSWWVGDCNIHTLFSCKITGLDGTADVLKVIQFSRTSDTI